jgi:hypothetical protein
MAIIPGTFVFEREQIGLHHFLDQICELSFVRPSEHFPRF